MAIAKVGDWIRPNCMPKGTRMQVEQSSRSSVSAKDWFFNHGSYDLLPAEGASSMSRDELAARCLASMLSCSGRTGRASDYAEDAVEAADALLLALTLTPAPVAPPAGKYEPRPGDYVTWGSCTAMWRVLRVDSGGVYAVFAEKRNYTTEPRYLDPSECETLRPATPSELAAAGLAVPPPAPTPAPEAKRPTHIRWTVSAFPDEARRVLRWVDGKPVVGRYNTRTGIDESKESDPIEPGGWAPAPCPPPVAGREVEAFVKAASAYCAVNYLPTYDESRVRLHHAMIEAWGAYARPVRP